MVSDFHYFAKEFRVDPRTKPELFPDAPYFLVLILKLTEGVFELNFC